MIEIIPSLPTKSDVVTLKVEQAACFSGNDDVRIVNENPVFTVEITTGICFQPVPTLRGSFQIGQLLPGNYTARIIFIEGPGPGASSGIIATEAFTVSGSQARSIPTLDAISILLLTITLALTVGKFMGKKTITSQTR
jgi:hypothetical protein